MPKPKKPGAKVRTELTDKERRFIDEYMKDQCGADAYRRTGYTGEHARFLAFSMLRRPHVKAEFDRRMAAVAKKADITAERVLKELARLAFFDVRKLYDDQGSPKPLHELDDDTAAAVAGLDIMEEYEGSGEDRKFVGYVKKYKISDKNTALSNAMRHLGMLKDKVEHSGTMTLEQLIAQSMQAPDVG